MTEDLSEFHKPVRNLCRWPGSPEEWNTLALSDDQVDSFRENGFLGGIKVLADPELETLRSEVEAVTRPEHSDQFLFHEFHGDESTDPETVLFHALGAWRITPGLHDLLWNPAVLMPAFQLLGGSVRFWHDQLFCKPARHGGVVAWHQDYSYWTRTEPLCHLTCWIALDDATIENGCLHYINGSQNWDLLPITGLAGDMKAIQTVLSKDQKAMFNPRPMELKAGECTFHHGLTIHGSFENRSSRPRRGAVLNFALDGVKSASDKPLLEGIPVIKEGRTLGGQFFPLLFTGP